MSYHSIEIDRKLRRVYNFRRSTMNTATKVDLEDLQSVMEALMKRLPKLDLTTKVDVAARLGAAMKTAKKIDSSIKDDIKAKCGGKPGYIFGEIFKAHFALVPTTRLNQKALKEDEPELFEKYQETEDEGRVMFEAR
jgi:hypothetical protein